MRGGMIQGLLATLQEGVIINLGTRRKRLLTRVEGGWVRLSAFLLPQIYKPHFLSLTVYLHLMKHIVLFFLPCNFHWMYCKLVCEAPTKHCYTFTNCFCDNTSSFLNPVTNTPLIIKKVLIR